MALVRCILGKFLRVVCHCFPLAYNYSAVIISELALKYYKLDNPKLSILSTKECTSFTF
jgi:hypothetical protein